MIKHLLSGGLIQAIVVLFISVALTSSVGFSQEEDPEGKLPDKLKTKKSDTKKDDTNKNHQKTNKHDQKSCEAKDTGEVKTIPNE